MHNPSGIVRTGIVSVAVAMAACGGSSTPIQPTPSIALTSVVVGVSGNVAAAVSPGDKLQLFAQAVYSDGSRSDVTNVATWQSSNPIVATVSNGGLLSAAAEGSLDVSASYQGQSGSLHADVRSCSATLSPASVTFGPFGGIASVQVATSDAACRWTARSDSSWLSFSYDPGKSGDGSFTYTAPANSTATSRAAKILVTIAGGPAVAHAIQQDRPLGCSYAVTPEQSTFPNSGGTGGFDLVTTPSDCQWTVTNNGIGIGIQITGRTSGTGNAHLSYSVAANPNATDVASTIEIRGLSGLNPPGVHRVTVVKK